MLREEIAEFGEAGVRMEGHIDGGELFRRRMGAPDQQVRPLLGAEPAEILPVAPQEAAPLGVGEAFQIGVALGRILLLPVGLAQPGVAPMPKG